MNGAVCQSHHVASLLDICDIQSQRMSENVDTMNLENLASRFIHAGCSRKMAAHLLQLHRPEVRLIET